MLVAGCIASCYLFNIVPLTYDRGNRHTFRFQDLGYPGEYFMRLLTNALMQYISRHTTQEQAFTTFSFDNDIRQISQHPIFNVILFCQLHFMHFHHQSHTLRRLCHIAYGRLFLFEKLFHRFPDASKTGYIFFIIHRRIEYHYTYRSMNGFIFRQKLRQHHLKGSFINLQEIMNNLYIFVCNHGLLILLK